MKKKICVILFLLIFFCIWFFYHVMEGFSIGNISANFPFQDEWEVAVNKEEIAEFHQIVNQPYHYLGKGRQSYAFVSEDQKYVIKFFKYKHYRLPLWIESFPSFSFIENYREKKRKIKEENLNRVIQSWKLAFKCLRKETGLKYMHLNQTNDLHAYLLIRDKIGLEYSIDLDKFQFCVQDYVKTLEETILEFKHKNKLQEAQVLISRLLELLLSENRRGFADNDFALLQNTGVTTEGQPIHIDFGEFIYSESVKELSFFRQELFSNTYGLMIWLKKEYPPLAQFLDKELRLLIGDSYETMEPIFHL